MVKELFVFGAGASRASAGTPLGSELVWSYYQDCCQMTPIIGGKPDNSDSNKRFANYEEFLEAAGKYSRDLSNEMNKFLNREDMIYFCPSNLGKVHYIDEILKVILRSKDYNTVNLIRLLIFEHLIQASIGKDNKLYELFVVKILERRMLDDISIISFNFDTLLNESLSNLHKDLSNKVSFDYLRTFDDIHTGRRKTYRRGNYFPLIKLNGSLDWGICRNCNKVHLYPPFMDREFYQRALCSFCNGMVEPYIIMPHQECEGGLNSLWEFAHTCISSAEKITIIGYSFPSYDKRVIELFRNAMGGDVQLEVVDKEPEGFVGDVVGDIAGKYKQLFPHLRKTTKVCVSGFEGYLKDKLGAEVKL